MLNLCLYQRSMAFLLKKTRADPEYNSPRYLTKFTTSPSYPYKSGLIRMEDSLFKIKIVDVSYKFSNEANHAWHIFWSSSATIQS